ncbi:helix-turn-helix domain-containing protein [Rhizobium sp. A22-96]
MKIAASIPRPARLPALLGAVCVEYGFELFLATEASGSGDERDEVSVIASNWPGYNRQLAGSIQRHFIKELRVHFKQSKLSIVRAPMFDHGERVGQQLQGVKVLGHSVAFSFYNGLGIHHIVAYTFGPETLSGRETHEMQARTIEAVRLAEQPNEPRERLSVRELQCLHWSAEGKSSVEIARILVLSPHTVNTHLRSAMQKLNVANRTHAVAEACRNGLI